MEVTRAALLLEFIYTDKSTLEAFINSRSFTDLSSFDL
jgi:hypothetical protein